MKKFLKYIGTSLIVLSFCLISPEFWWINALLFVIGIMTISLSFIYPPKQEDKPKSIAVDDGEQFTVPAPLTDFTLTYLVARRLGADK